LIAFGNYWRFWSCILTASSFYVSTSFSLESHGDFTTTYIKALLLLPLAFYGIRLPKKKNSPFLWHSME
jgi:hypothetical protein